MSVGISIGSDVHIASNQLTDAEPLTGVFKPHHIQKVAPGSGVVQMVYPSQGLWSSGNTQKFVTADVPTTDGVAPSVKTPILCEGVGRLVFNMYAIGVEDAFFRCVFFDANMRIVGMTEFVSVNTVTDGEDYNDASFATGGAYSAYPASTAVVAGERYSIDSGTRFVEVVTGGTTGASAITATTFSNLIGSTYDDNGVVIRYMHEVFGATVLTRPMVIISNSFGASYFIGESYSGSAMAAGFSYGLM